MQPGTERTGRRLEPGAILGGRYELGSRIAIGGMGEVWNATDGVLGRVVAIKVLRDALAGSTEFVERFRAEARHTASLAHPGIASVYDYGEDDDFAFLVMELVDGEPLSNRLHREALTPLPVALSILAQAGDALQAAHDAGVVHRDVKPGNLMLRPDGTVKVTDFGIARAIDSAPVTAVGQVVGTAQYMAPEQATGQSATPASDVYSLGVIGYEMLAGKRPFEADSAMGLAMAHVHEPPPPLPTTVPAGVRALIDQALRKNPEERPASAHALAADARRQLLAVMPPPAGDPATLIATAGRLEQTEVAPARVDRVIIPQSAIRPHRVRAVALAACALVLLVVGIALARRGEDPRTLIDGTSVSAVETIAVDTAAQPVVAETTPAVVMVDPAVVVGYGVDQSTLVLKQLGFVVKTESEKGKAAEGTVLRVEPSGEQPYGSTVTLFVSSGKGKGHGNDD